MREEDIKRRRSWLLYGVATAALILPTMGSVPAFGQDAAADDEDEEVEEIVVTGSRIRRAEFQSVQPTVTIDSAFIDERGFTNVADALNEIPSFGVPGNSTTGGQGITNAGANFVNLFGLGSQRTLTLVNGRRVVAANAPSNFNAASPGQQVDLNIIPTALVDRIENISIGGAPIYGSDAIAGTVNVILKDDFEGVSFDAQYGVAQRGDADNYRLRGIVGGNFADGRGNAVVTVEYNELLGLAALSRDEFLRSGQSFQPTADCGDAGRCLLEPVRVSFATHGGLPSVLSGIPTVNQILITAFGGLDTAIRDGAGNVLQFGPEGTLIPFDPGTRGSFIFAEGGDGVNLADLATLRTPLKRIVTSGLASYQITDNTKFFVETLYANSRATDLLSQAVWWTDFFGAGSGALEFSVDHPFLDPSARATIIQNNDRMANDLGAPPGTFDTFFVSRSGLDIIDGENTSEMNLFRIVSGLEGEFEFGGNTWNWDASYNLGRTRVDSAGPSLNSQRLAWALDAVVDPATGLVVCNVTIPGNEPTAPGDDFSVPDAGFLATAAKCVPLNVFGVNRSSAEARAYVTEIQTSATKILQQIFSANMTGDLFELPAGPLAIAGGVEHRREQAAFIPDESFRRGLGRGVPVAGVAGGFNTYEAYGEFVAPIISDGGGLPIDIPFIKSLDIEAKLRFVDHSLAGSDRTWTAGGRLRLDLPFMGDGLEIRGNFTRSIRSPALVELFLPTVQIFTFVNDPCDAGNVTGGPDPATRQANCQTLVDSIGAVDGLGVPINLLTFQSNARNGSILGTSGGNTELSNEKASSWSVGGVITPPFIPGFSASIDYVNISIDNAISNLNATALAEACFDGPSGGFPNEFCAFLQRDGNFQLTFAKTGFANAGILTFSAIQASFRYNTAIADIPLIGGDFPGELQISGNFYHLIDHFISVTGFDQNFQDGEIGRSKLKYQINLRYTNDRFSLLLQERYVGPAIFNNNNTPTSQEFLGVGAYYLFNTTIGYQITDGISARLVINNIFDQTPPFPSGASGNQIVTYDFLGRYFFGGLTASF